MTASRPVEKILPNSVEAVILSKALNFLIERFAFSFSVSLFFVKQLIAIL